MIPGGIGLTHTDDEEKGWIVWEVYDGDVFLSQHLGKRSRAFGGEGDMDQDSGMVPLKTEIQELLLPKEYML